MSWLTKVALKRRWLTFLLVALLVGASIYATINLKMELIPDIQVPVISIISQYPQASPKTVMDKVTIPIEDAIRGMGSLKHIQSTSAENLSFIILDFEYGTDMEAVKKDIEQRLQEANLPLTAQSFIFPIGLEMLPTVALSLYGEGKSTLELRRIAEEEILPALSEVGGLLPEEKESAFMKSIDIMGGKERASIYLDPEKMNQSGIPMSWVVQSILAPLQQDPNFIYEFDTIGNSPIFNFSTTPLSPTPVSLNELAQVEPPIYTSRTNGNPSIALLVRKDPEANTVTVANAIMAKIAEIEPSLSEQGVEVVTIFDQSEIIEEAIQDITREAIIGAILAIIIIFLFLWAFRASLVVVVSIPLSILVAFLIMYATGITINILTLSAIAIAVGRLVDDSIVVLENTYRHLQRGEGFKQAALDGAREVAIPITSATIATVAIFIPLAFIGGIAGELFRPFALTLTFALLLSLLVTLMVVPPLSSFIRTRKVRFEGTESWYHRIYTRMLKWSLGHRAYTLAIAGVLFIGSFGLIPIIGTSFLPSGVEPMIMVTIEMPEATDVELSQKMEEVSREVDKLKGVENYYAIMGSPITGMPIEEIGGATLMITLSPKADVEGEAANLDSACESIRDENTTIKVTTGQAMAEMMGGGNALTLRVTGNDLKDVEDYTKQLTASLKALEGKGSLTDLESTLVLGGTKPEITFDPVRIAAKGLNPEKVMGEWAMMRYGYPLLLPGQEPPPSPKVNINGENFDILIPGIVKGIRESQLEELRLGATNPVPLGDIIVGEAEWGAASYHRAEWNYTGTITATITGEDVGAVNREVQDRIDALTLPSGIEIKTGGIMEMMGDTFRDMLIAILIAIVIAYFVIVASLRSFLNPLIIMVSLPLASIGALLGLLITGRTLGASASMGVLMLVGIVLTNAIVLLTFVEDLRKQGRSVNDALVEGGRIRLRPILMTALTTMIALVPLALGLEASVLMAAELATIVIGGLFTSTLLTLVVIPVIYSLKEGWRHRPS